MGRYLDELRRITRAESGAADTPPESSEEPPRKPYRLLLGVVVGVLLIGVALLVLRQVMADAKLQDCVMSGRKNCAPVDMGR
jgi:hypothetical protein